MDNSTRILELSHLYSKNTQGPAAEVICALSRRKDLFDLQKGYIANPGAVYFITKSAGCFSIVLYLDNLAETLATLIATLIDIGPVGIEIAQEIFSSDIIIDHDRPSIVCRNLSATENLTSVESLIFYWILSFSIHTERPSPNISLLALLDLMNRHA